MNAEELKRYYIETGIYERSELERLEETTFRGTDFQWYKYIYQPAPLYSVDASISGGSQKTSYYLSGSFLDQKGLRLGSGYQKVSGRLNLNTSLNSKLHFGLNTSVSYDKSQVSPFGNNNGSGGGLAPLNAPFLSPFDPDTGEELEYIPLLNSTTPKHAIAKLPAASNSYVFSASGNVNYTPINNLTLRSNIGLEMSYGNGYSRMLPSYRNAYGVGNASRNYASGMNFSVTNTASYLMRFGKHNLTALLGQEYTSLTSDGFSAYGSGILDDRLTLLSHTNRDQSVREFSSNDAYLSFFTQLAYDYRERYFVDLVLRNDASSRFGANRRNALFWSLGLLWKAKNEEALRKLEWLDILDVKASYGTQGNSSIQPFAIDSYAGKVGVKNGDMSLGFVSLGNPDLVWEKQSKFTVGVKARFLNRFEINLEYYNRVTSDMLFEVPLALSTGLPTSEGYVKRIENVGRLLNHGIDLQLRVDLWRGKDYRFSLYGNMSYNRDKVLELFEGRKDWFEPGFSFAYIVGEPVTYMLPLYKGVNSQTGYPEWYQPGEYIGTTTRDNSRVVTEWSNHLAQNTGIPAYTPLTGGWGIDAEWKGFSLTADFFFAIGKYIISKDKEKFENDFYVRDKQGYYNGSRRLFDYWKQPGDVAEFPSLEYVRANRQSQYFDDKMLENASFMRLKNLTIAYRVPQYLLGKRSFISSAKLYFSGRNLLTFTGFRGIDPEVNNSVAFGVNPNTKQYSLGVELTF